MTDMENSHRNRLCGCARCRTRGYLGPAVLVTLGVLFLIDQFTRYGFGETWPILLIVIGVVIFLQRTASGEGHQEAGASGEGEPPIHPPQVPHV